MRKFFVLSSALFLLSVVVENAWGETASFGFTSDPSPYFTTVNTGGVWTVEPSVGSLRISKSVDALSVNPSGDIVGGLRSKFKVAGDFTATVDFTLTNFPASNTFEGYNELPFNAIDETGNGFLDIFRFTNNTFTDLLGSWVVPPGTWAYYGNSSLAAGRYRIQRSGSTTTASIAPPDSESFVPIATTSGLIDPMTLTLFALQISDNGVSDRSYSAMDVRYDNLSITADHFIGTVPEPGTLVLLGVGAVGLIGYSNGGVDHAFLYSGGSMHDLGTLPGGTGAVATGINNAGQVTGYSYTAVTLNAFLYSGGSMQDIGTIPGGTHSKANAINNNGQIVGYAGTTGMYGSYAFLYSGGSMQNIGTLGGWISYALGINDNGLVVGESYPSDSSTFHAFLYSGGSMLDLGTFGGTFSSANGINNEGQVVGMATTAGGPGHAFLCNSGSSLVLQDLGTLDGPYNIGSCASGINNLGQVVGSAFTAGNAAHAFLYSGGSMQDLNSLIGSNAGWTLENATGINENGQICGYGTNPSGQTHAFLLTPTPEPGTLALLAVGAIGLVGWVWRRSMARRGDEADGYRRITR